MSRREVLRDSEWWRYQADRGQDIGDHYEEVVTALEQLPSIHRSVLERLFWERMSQRELAAELGISQPAVHKRKQRALEALREVLNETRS